MFHPSALRAPPASRGRGGCAQRLGFLLVASFAGDNPLEESLERAQIREQRYLAFLERACAREPAFAEASRLHPPERSHWQAAVWLLTGCRPVWCQLRSPVLADRSLAPVAAACARRPRHSRGSEPLLIEWAAHLGDPTQPAPAYPDGFSDFTFRRWVAALHIRRRLAPTEDLFATRHERR